MTVNILDNPTGVHTICMTENSVITLTVKFSNSKLLEFELQISIETFFFFLNV